MDDAEIAANLEKFAAALKAGARLIKTPEGFALQMPATASPDCMVTVRATRAQGDERRIRAK
jgi:hypothetical protein